MLLWKLKENLKNTRHKKANLNIRNCIEENESKWIKSLTLIIFKFKDPSKPYTYNRFLIYFQDNWIILGVKKMQDLLDFWGKNNWRQNYFWRINLKTKAN